MEEPILNSHNKDEFPPAHTAEHILNQTMVRTFGCQRSQVNHIERKKSKCNYQLSVCPSEEEIRQVEAQVNAIIAQNLLVETRFVSRDQLPPSIDISRLPKDASDTLRLVFIGNYDVCPCLGNHVKSTAEIGSFRITSTSFNEGNFRIVFRVSPGVENE